MYCDLFLELVVRRKRTALVDCRDKNITRLALNSLQWCRVLASFILWILLAERPTLIFLHLVT